MSRDNLGSKQTIILHNCLINNERYDFVIKPIRQTIGYIRTKRKHIDRKLLTNKNKLLGNDFQNEETQSQNRKQAQNKNFRI